MHLQQVLEKLPAELKAQQKNHTAVMRRLRAESATWLTTQDNMGAKQNSCDAFILHWWVVLASEQTVSPPRNRPVHLYCAFRSSARRTGGIGKLCVNV